MRLMPYEMEPPSVIRGKCSLLLYEYASPKPESIKKKLTAT